MTRAKYPLLLSCLSVCLLAACGKKDAEADANKAEAKATGDSKPATETPAAPQATAPKGKDAPGNLEPVVKAAMAVTDCKFDEDNEYLANDCEPLDAMTKIIDDLGDDKLPASTLVNLLGEKSDQVRSAASDYLVRGGWQTDADLVATVVVALGTETHDGVADNLGSALRDVEDKLMEAPQVVAAYQGALAAQAGHEQFDALFTKLRECESATCDTLMVHAAKQNPDLENRSYAARELMDDDKIVGDSCTVVADVAIALSQAKPADEEAEFQPYSEASAIIDDLLNISIEVDGKPKDCAAELPRLLDEATNQANAGTLNSDVFYAVLNVERREDKATYMPKLEALAKAVEANAKLEEDMRNDAKSSLEDWKEG